MWAATRREALQLAVGSAVAAAGALAQPSGAEAAVLADGKVRAHGPVALVSDSQSSGYMSDLQAKLRRQGVGPYRLDIHGARRITKTVGGIKSGVACVQRLRRSHLDLRVWMLSLGGNDFRAFTAGKMSPEHEISSLLDLFTPEDFVVWFTVWHPKVPEMSHTFNSVLNAIAADRSNVDVADWAALAEVHPEWGYGDGVHINFKGARVRNQFLADSAVAACIEQAGPAR